jgi:hypothetical protein
MMNESQPPGNPEHQHGSNEDRREILPESSSLIILLILFGAICVVTLAVILGGQEEPGVDEILATEAFGPADFPEIDFDEPLLHEIQAAGPSTRQDAFMVPAPPFTEGFFPCSECHADLEPNLERRDLEDFHDDIELVHGPKDRWCFDCHNPDDRDRLRLISGELISFEESYRLCGQCHGTIFRDWRNGIHGRRRGYWNGAKSYLLCAHCHNPHAPKFKPIEPLPPPVKPDFLHQPEGSLDD